MGHFTALVPSGNRQQQLVVPLTDNSGHVLPIRFLLRGGFRGGQGIQFPPLNIFYLHVTATIQSMKNSFNDV